MDIEQIVSWFEKHEMKRESDQDGDQYTIFVDYEKDFTVGSILNGPAEIRILLHSHFTVMVRFISDFITVFECDATEVKCHEIYERFNDKIIKTISQRQIELNKIALEIFEKCLAS